MIRFIFCFVVVVLFSMASWHIYLVGYKDGATDVFEFLHELGKNDVEQTMFDEEH